MKSFIKDKIIGRDNCKKQKDEVSEISYLIEEMKEGFVTAIRQTKDESDAIHVKMKDANSKVSSISSNNTEISAAMEETGANVDTQTDSIRRIEQTCKEAAEVIGSLARDAGEMAVKASVNENLQQITYSSENVPQETNGVFDSIGTLQRTMNKFSV